MYVFVDGDVEHLSVFRWDETSEAGGVCEGYHLKNHLKIIITWRIIICSKDLVYRYFIYLISLLVFVVLVSSNDVIKNIHFAFRCARLITKEELRNQRSISCVIVVALGSLLIFLLMFSCWLVMLVIGVNI